MPIGPMRKRCRPCRQLDGEGAVIISLLKGADVAGSSTEITAFLRQFDEKSSHRHQSDETKSRFQTTVAGGRLLVSRYSILSVLLSIC